ncbi:heat shock protein 27-like [Culicoides brevitarsis]|uniref:heat shock protein 27-like n=1 Tax=Culicoides brevitarsis TaxID=469753 RepID=UPI00307B902B
MSIIPHILRQEPAIYDTHFGQIIHPDMMKDIFMAPHKLRSLHLADQVGDKSPLSLLTKDGFQVCLDVQQFEPKEITVKAVDNQIIVEGKHEEKDDHHGSISRHFVRKYTLPKDIDIADLHTTLSSDGILTLKAHKKAEGNAKIVPIQQTGPARSSIKHN